MPENGEDESIEPLAGYQYWDDHPRYRSSYWRQEVRDENTRAGYWTWAKCRLAEDLADESEAEDESATPDR